MAWGMGLRQKIAIHVDEGVKELGTPYHYVP